MKIKPKKVKHVVAGHWDKPKRKPTREELDRLARFHKEFGFKKHGDAIVSWGRPDLDISPNDLREHIKYRNSGLHVVRNNRKA